jgi:REP element-mobilizing transposase RayT
MCGSGTSPNQASNFLRNHVRRLVVLATGNEIKGREVGGRGEIVGRKRKDRQLEFDFCKHGGKRKGAGRKPKGPEPEIPHKPRAAMKRDQPLHVTARLAEGLPSLRRGAEIEIVLRALAAARLRHGMRIVHYSIQGNHLHLIVEAESRACVAKGMNALLSPLARALNRLWGRSGPVFPQRFHDEVIATPTQARNALRYVLQNGKKHGVVPRASIDPCSSALAFDGWAISPSIPLVPSFPPLPVTATCPVAPASVWLLTTGWRRLGLIALDELPRVERPARSRPNPADSSRRRLAHR